MILLAASCLTAAALLALWARRALAVARCERYLAQMAWEDASDAYQAAHEELVYAQAMSQEFVLS